MEHQKKSFLKQAIKNPYVQGAALLLFALTNFQPKPGSLAALGIHVATQVQGATAQAIDKTTKPAPQYAPRRK